MSGPGLTWIAMSSPFPRSKHGEKRRVYLNDDAVAAFQLLWRFSEGKGKVFEHLYSSVKTIGARRWFECGPGGVRDSQLPLA